MNNEHPISDEVLDMANIALSKGEHWMTYNKSLYLIDKNDVRFFNNETDANEFADNNSDRDFFNVMQFDYISDILQRIPYGRNYQSKSKEILLLLKTNNYYYLIHNQKQML